MKLGSLRAPSMFAYLRNEPSPNINKFILIEPEQPKARNSSFTTLGVTIQIVDGERFGATKIQRSLRVRREGEKLVRCGYTNCRMMNPVVQ